MKKLAIIGASYLQQPLVEKCRELGVYSICFAWEEGAVCKDLCDKFYPISTIDKAAILKVCQEEKIDGITTIASDVATLTVNYVAEQMGLVGNPDKYSQVSTNKYLMRQCFMDNDVPSPKFCLTEGEVPEMAKSFKFPVIVKPTDRSGSRGVEKVEQAAELPQAIKRACNESFQKKAVIEEFIEGREISVESISFKGKHYILQITDKVTTEAPFFVELEHHQPSSLPEEIKNRVRETVLHALGALHIRYGASHAELKITADGDIRVIEIGARMGGDFIGSDLVKLSTGYDFLKGVIDVAFGQFEEPKLTESKCAGVYFLCEETREILPIIQNAEKYPEIVRAELTDTVLRKVEQSADRSGYFIYKTSNKRFFDMKRLALIGSKDFADQIQRFAEKTGEFEVVGYFDDFEPKGKIIRSLPVMGKIEEIEDVYNTGAFDYIFLAAGYNNFKFREDVFNSLYGKVPFANIIMPSAKIASDVKMGEGVFVGAGTIIDKGSEIGDNVFIHGSSTIGHENIVGSHTYFSGRFNSAGFVTIGKRCFLGICTCISDHITICDDVWIGLACVVAKNIKEPGKYMSPAAKLYKIE